MQGGIPISHDGDGTAVGLFAHAISRDLTRHRYVFGGDDAYQAAIHIHLGGHLQAAHVDQIGERHLGFAAGEYLGACSYVDIAASQRHRIGGVDAAFHQHQASRAQWQMAREGFGGGIDVYIAARRYQPVHEHRRGGSQCQAANIQHAAATHRYSVRVEEEHIATDGTVFVGVDQPVDVRAMVSHQVEQVGRAARQMQVNRGRLVNIEPRERIEGVGPSHGLRGDVGHRAVDAELGLGATVWHDGLALHTGCGQRHGGTGHHADVRNGIEPCATAQHAQILTTQITQG